MSEPTEPTSDKSFVVFGRDLAKIPCFRNSFYYGITGGFVCGLARFMFTSRPKSAADFAMGSFVLITMSYWLQCRYHFSKMNMEMKRTKYLLEQHTMLEGTATEKEINSNPENVLVDA